MIKKISSPIVMETISDPQELEKFKDQDERFLRNWKWFNSHAADIYPKYRGKILCIAGQELFAADTTEEVLALAKAAHPEDSGSFTIIVPKEKGYRIYANRRLLASLR